MSAVLTRRPSGEATVWRMIAETAEITFPSGPSRVRAPWVGVPRDQILARLTEDWTVMRDPPTGTTALACWIRDESRVRGPLLWQVIAEPAEWAGIWPLSAAETQLRLRALWVEAWHQWIPVVRLGAHNPLDRSVTGRPPKVGWPTDPATQAALMRRATPVYWF